MGDDEDDEDDDAWVDGLSSRSYSGIKKRVGSIKLGRLREET